MPTPARPAAATSARSRLPLKIWVWALGVLLASIAVAPFIYFVADMVFCWFPWAHASGGNRPWDIYALTAHNPGASVINGVEKVNYPPFLLYLLTLVEKARLLLHAAPDGRVMVLLVKVGPILAHVAGVLVCAFGLRPVYGTRAAVAAAAAYALTIALWFNGAVWGQFDSVLSLATLLVVVAALRRQPGWCGVAAGWALSIKLQAMLAAPAVAVYLWRRTGLAGVVKASITAAAFLAIAIVPFVLNGQGKGVYDSYFNAVSYYPRRTMTAFNVWYLMDGIDVNLRHIPADTARVDYRPAVGPLNYRRLGLLLVAADLLLIAGVLYRKPADRLLPLAAGLGVFAFFMLSTEMHGRYVLPGVALLAIVWGVLPEARWLWIGLTITATLNPAVTLLRDNVRAADGTVPAGWDHATLAAAAVIALANVVLFLGAHVVYLRAARREPLPRAVPEPIAA